MGPRTLSLRARLLLGQIFPVLLVPLLCLGLVYMLVVSVWIPSIANDITVEGYAILAASREQSNFWSDPLQAQTYLKRLVIHPNTRVMLLDSSAGVLAATESGHNTFVLPDVRLGSLQQSWQVAPGLFSATPRLQVTIPALDTSGKAAGYILLIRSLSDLHNGLLRVLIFIVAIVLLGALLSTLIGLSLSRTIAEPIQEISRAISEAPMEGPAMPLAVEGLEEYRTLSQALNRLQERRVRLEEARQQMMANMVHELGRPLGSLQAAIHALRSGASEDPALREEILQGMGERIERMSRLVDDLAAGYKQGLSQWELDRHLTAPVSWLKVLIPLWAEKARLSGLSWQADIPEEMPFLPMDAERMAQALTNLVDNAIKFTPRGGSVKLEAGFDLHQVWFRVIDTGIGIRPEHLGRIFEPFYRAVEPGWRAPGLGLGLSIVKSIVEAHGGTVEVISEPEKGSRFTICLPVGQESDA